MSRKNTRFNPGVSAGLTRYSRRDSLLLLDEVGLRHLAGELRGRRSVLRPLPLLPITLIQQKRDRIEAVIEAVREHAARHVKAHGRGPRGNDSRAASPIGQPFD